MANDSDLSLRRGSTWRSATIVDGGEYAIATLLPGEWEASIRSDDYAKVIVPVTLGTEPVQTRDFVLTRAQRIDVFLRTSNGKQLVSAARELHWRFAVVAVEHRLAGDLPATDNSTVGEIGIGRYRNGWSGGGKGPRRGATADAIPLLGVAVAPTSARPRGAQCSARLTTKTRNTPPTRQDARTPAIAARIPGSAAPPYLLTGPNSVSSTSRHFAASSPRPMPS